MLKTQLLMGFGIASALVCLFFFVLAVYLYKKGGSSKRALSSVHIFTIGVFASVILMFVPICYHDPSLMGPYAYVRPFLIVIHDSLRVFIMDMDYQIVLDAIQCEETALYVGFSAYAAVLYVLAPVLTFSNVLAVVINVNDLVRYWWHWRKKQYIMSDLNERSIALAKSIRDREPGALIIFAGLPARGEDEQSGCLDQARDMKAICLRRDVAKLNVHRKKSDVELFLISENESVNVDLAISITQELNEKNKKYNVKIFVFCSKTGPALVLDSIRYDNLLRHAADNNYGDHCFKLRRIDEKRQLIWNTVPTMNLFEVGRRHDGALSVLICGFGSYGMEFFKTVLWYCQFEGYKLQLNIVDQQGKQACDKDRIQKLINRACPELLKTNRIDVEGEAYYDIEIIPGIDLDTSDFDELLQYSGEDEKLAALSQRLKNTDLAFVSLGDDERDIEVAIHLRSLFDRVNAMTAGKQITWAQEPVDIYAVVCDDEKTEILNDRLMADGSTREMRNFKNVPYHIHFIGALSTQLAYENIYDGKLENDAFQHHISWVENEEQIYNELEADPVKREVAGETLKPREETAFFQAKAQGQERENRNAYEQHEYFRLSSIAKELYVRRIQGDEGARDLTKCLEAVELKTCECENCCRRKRSEHMRWNAYMRCLGYSYQDGLRADRAKLHHNLRVWKDLSIWDRDKD